MTQWTDEAMTRQGLYRFLAAAMMPPAPDRMALLSSSADVLEDRDLDRYSYALPWRRFVEALESVDEGGVVGADYVRLFGVGMGGTPAPPNESYYRLASPGGGVADFMSTLESDYRAMGVESTAAGEAPDHLSTELEVMSFQCATEFQAWSNGEPEEAVLRQGVELKFLRSHLAAWVPTFAGLVRAANPTEFYGALCDVIEAFTTHEVDYLGAVVPVGGVR